MAISLPPSLLAAIAAAQGKAPGATPAASDPNTPMGAFAALAPQVLNSQASFARPEAAAWLASMTGQAQPQWSMTPEQLAEAKRAASRSRLPAPPKRPQAQGATPRPPAFFGGGMFQIPANIQALIAQYRAGQIPAQGQTSGATNTTGPAPSAFAGLNRFQGPFGNGGGGLNMQALIDAARGRIL